MKLVRRESELSLMNLRKTESKATAEENRPSGETMNKHLNDGQLRAALDGELDATSQSHLDSCSACQARQKVLSAQIEKPAQKLAFLSRTESEKIPSA
jgi:hypothetical protein